MSYGKKGSFFSLHRVIEFPPYELVHHDVTSRDFGQSLLVLLHNDGDGQVLVGHVQGMASHVQGGEVGEKALRGGLL